MNTDSTVKNIRDAAERMNYYARQMEKIAEDMEKTGDFSYSGEALNVISNMIMNLRLDLFVTRPIREIQKRVYELEDME